uniref:DNA polymerase sliding clamp b n=1 Tax=Borely moumouvirus TaxID=2712067 RepID=A0A6G6ADX4_9VIRU
MDSEEGKIFIKNDYLLFYSINKTYFEQLIKILSVCSTKCYFVFNSSSIIILGYNNKLQNFFVEMNVENYCKNDVSKIIKVNLHELNKQIDVLNNSEKILIYAKYNNKLLLKTIDLYKNQTTKIKLSVSNKKHHQFVDNTKNYRENIFLKSSSAKIMLRHLLNKSNKVKITIKNNNIFLKDVNNIPKPILLNNIIEITYNSLELYLFTKYLDMNSKIFFQINNDFSLCLKTNIPYIGNVYCLFKNLTT